MKYHHYQVFANELSRYEIPRTCAGPVLYSYWQVGNAVGTIDIDRLLRDLDSGHISSKRGFGTKTVAVLKKHFCDEAEPVYRVNHS